MPARLRDVRGPGPVHRYARPSWPAWPPDRVWEDDRQDPQAIRSWLTATGTYRHLGDPPAGAQVVDPTLDDGYLLLARREHTS